MKNSKKELKILKKDQPQIVDQKQNRNNDSLFQKFIEIFLLLKAIILKITLIALLIKIIKKYKHIRQFLKFMNALIVGIFGFSIFDLWGFDLFRGWMGWVRETAVYIWFAALIASRETIETKIPSSEKRSVRGIDWSTANAKTKNIENSTENRWFDSFDTETAVTTSNDYTYVYLLMFLIFAGFCYYNRDEIYRAWNIFKGRPDNPPAVSPGAPDPNPEGFTYIEDPEPVNRDILDRIKYVIWGDKQAKLKESVKDKFYGGFDNTSQETITPMATSSKVKLDKSPLTSFEQNLKSKNIFGKGKEVETFDRDDIMDWMPPEMLTAQITGQNVIDFDNKSATLMHFINKFLTCQKVGSFPTVALQQGIYHTLRANLYNLSMNSQLYDKWLRDPTVESKIDQFVQLEDDVLNNSSIENNQQELSTGSDSPQSQTTTRSQSPITVTQTPLELIQDEVVEDAEKSQVVIESLQHPSTSRINLLDRIKARRSSIIGSPETNSETLPVDQPQTEIIESGQSVEIIGSNSVENPRMSLFEAIRARRNDSDVVTSPVRETVEEIAQDDQDNFLSTPAVEIVDSLQASEIETATNSNIREATPVVDTSRFVTINQQFEDTLALFDDGDDTLVQDEPQDSVQHIPSETTTSEDILERTINSWDKVICNVDNSIVNIELGEMWKSTKKVVFKTTDGIIAECNFDPNHLNVDSSKKHVNETIDLKKVIKNVEDVQLYSIAAEDINGNTIPIWLKGSKVDLLKYN